MLANTVFIFPPVLTWLEEWLFNSPSRILSLVMALVGLNEALLIGAGLIALIWGPKKLPKLARSLGRSKYEYKEAVEDAKQEYEDAVPDAESEVEDTKAS